MQFSTPLLFVLLFFASFSYHLLIYKYIEGNPHNIYTISFKVLSEGWKGVANGLKGVANFFGDVSTAMHDCCGTQAGSPPPYSVSRVIVLSIFLEADLPMRPNFSPSLP
jgi:hypothetical protein